MSRVSVDVGISLDGFIACPDGGPEYIAPVYPRKGVKLFDNPEG